MLNIYELTAIAVLGRMLECKSLSPEIMDFLTDEERVELWGNDYEANKPTPCDPITRRGTSPIYTPESESQPNNPDSETIAV